MPQPPEMVHESATPSEILARLDLLRERYRTGLMDAAAFNDTLSAFQFTDEVGHVWAPGVNSTRWYRWDRTEWTAADPPARLNLPGMPIMFERGGIGGSAASPPAPAPEAARPAAVSSTVRVPAASVPPVTPAPAGPIAASVAPPVQAKFCPQCGAPAAGKKFCSKCGRKLG